MDILDWVYGQRLVSPLWMRHLYWLFWGKEYPFKREEDSIVLRIIEKDDEQRYLKDIYC